MKQLLNSPFRFLKRKPFVALIVSLTIASSVWAESNVKKLVLTDCSAALELVAQASPEEQRDLIEYLERVINLEAPSQVDPLGIDLHPRSGPLSGEDFLRSVRPTRELDAKLCASRIAAKIPAGAVRLIPALFRLGKDPLLSVEAKFEMRETIRKIATAAAAASPAAEEKGVLKFAGDLPLSGDDFDAESILVEFRARSREVLMEMLKSAEPAKRVSAERALRLIDPTGALAASAVEAIYNSVTGEGQEALLQFLSQFDSSASTIGLAFRSSGTAVISSAELSFLKGASEPALDTFMQEPANAVLFHGFVSAAPPAQLRDAAMKICRHGRCDPALRELIRKADLSEELKLRVLAVLAAAESFDEELWMFARGELQSTVRKAAALEALGAFSAKKTESLELTSQVIEKARDAQARTSRPLLVRSLARLITRLAPIPIRYLREPLGTELLGLEVTAAEPLLPANAVSAFQPPATKLFLSALESKAEGIRKQGLAAIAQTKPIDNALIEQLLILSADETGGQSADVLSAEGTLEILAERIIPQLRVALGRKRKTALVAAELILKHRKGDAAAVMKLAEAFTASDCATRLRWFELIRSQAVTKRAELWSCREELMATEATRLPFLKAVTPISAEEWIAIIDERPGAGLRAIQQVDDFVEAGAPHPQIAGVLKARLDQRSSLDETYRILSVARKLSGKQESLREPLLRLAQDAGSSGPLRLAAAATLFHLDPESGAPSLLDLLGDSALVRLVPEYLNTNELLDITERASGREIKFGMLWPILCKLGPAAGKFELLFARDIVVDRAIALACIAPSSPELPKILHTLSFLPDWRKFEDAPLPRALAPVLRTLSKGGAQQVESQFEAALYLNVSNRLDAVKP